MIAFLWEQYAQRLVCCRFCLLWRLQLVQTPGWKGLVPALGHRLLPRVIHSAKLLVPEAGLTLKSIA